MVKNRIAMALCDLGYGDQRKGATVDSLARTYGVQLVVLTNGGSQRAHNVVTPEGRHHKYSQFGSATFLPQVKTHLSKFVLVDPITLIHENQDLRSVGVSDALDRLTIHREALVITQLQRAANRLREYALGDKRHGSCGMGIRDTQVDFDTHGKSVVLTIGDLADEEKTRRKLMRLLELKREELKDILSSVVGSSEMHEELITFESTRYINSYVEFYKIFARTVESVDDTYVRSLLAKTETLVTEPGQGVLLDQDYGFYPYCTWSHTTFDNATRFLKEADYDGNMIRIGLTRAVPSRHGRGPMPTEDAVLTELFPDAYNPTNPWQGSFRVGYLDLVTLRYANEVAGGTDFLGVSHLDQLDSLTTWKVCSAYRYDGQDNPVDFFELKDGLVTAIKVKKPTTVEHQSQLTQLLTSCQPIYRTIETREVASFIRDLERELDTPVALTACGPTANDTTIVRPFVSKK